jgi:glycosyltransferase involved in cell wall biosynthesis
MRVMLLTDLYAPVVGGLEVHVQSLARELAASGHDVAVVTGAQPGQPAEELDGAIAVHRIEGWSRVLNGRYRDPAYRFVPPAPDPGMTQALWRLVRRHRPDVVHAHSWIVYSYLPLKRLSGAALVMTLHDYGLGCARKSNWQVDRRCAGASLARCMRCAPEQYGSSRGVALATALRMSRPLHSSVDRFIAVSRSVADASRAAARGRAIEVIPNFLPPGVEGLGRGPRPAFLPAEDGYVLYVGALAPHKGVDVLLRARAAMDAPPHLVVIGHPAGVDVAAGDGVSVVPGASRDDVMAAWAGAAVGAVPSVWDEPCPTVALEAMSRGVPLVASAVGGLPDLVGDAGLLVAPGDPAALSAALDRLARDDALRRRMSAAARRRAGGLTAEAVVPRIEQVYAAVTQERAA